MAAWKNCLGPDTDVHVLANQENSSRTVDGSLSLEQTDYVTKWHQRHQFILLRINGVILHAEISTSIRKRSLSVTTGATALLPLPPLILSLVDCCFVGLGEGRGRGAVAQILTYYCRLSAVTRKHDRKKKGNLHLEIRDSDFDTIIRGK